MSRTHPFFISQLFLMILIIAACQSDTNSNPTEVVLASTGENDEIQDSLLRHVVIFKFKEESSEEDISRLNNSFLALGESIPVVKDFEWGINHSPEGLDQDFTHCYLLTFESETDRDSIYAPHPEHQAFVQSLQPHLEKVFVVDYWTNPK